jgi:hypothetical protein
MLSNPFPLRMAAFIPNLLALLSDTSRAIDARDRHRFLGGGRALGYQKDVMEVELRAHYIEFQIR